MIIALDYDDTYTADPELWDRFVDAAIELGHRVICCTCRRDTPENREIVRIPGARGHYFTGLSPKRWYLMQNGVDVDVWIDDLPESVKEGR